MRATPLPPGIEGWALRSAQGAEFGVSPGRARGADVRHPHRGVLAFGSASSDTAVRCREYEPVLQSGQFFSHRTAARLWGAWVPTWGVDEAREPLDVAVLGQGGAPHRPGVRGWRVSGIELALARGLPVVSAADAWCQLGHDLDVAALIAAGDALLGSQHRDPATSLAALALVLDRHQGKRGMRAVRAAFPHLRVGVDSPRETQLRLLLVAAGLPEPVIAHPVPVTDDLTLHPDLAYPDERIAIEYEGDGHRTSRLQWQRDVSRAELLQDVRWRLVRVVASDLTHGRAILIARLERLLRERAS